MVHIKKYGPKQNLLFRAEKCAKTLGKFIKIGSLGRHETLIWLFRKEKHMIIINNQLIGKEMTTSMALFNNSDNLRNPESVLVSYLDRRSIAMARMVCKAWHGNTSLTNAYNLHKQRWQAFNLGYPEDIVKAFEEGKIVLAELPTLTFQRPQLDHIEIKPESMKFPIMRFNDNGRPGVALKVTSTIPNQPELSAVVTIFQRYSSQNKDAPHDRWLVSNSSSSDLTNQIREAHIPEHKADAITLCERCPNIVLMKPGYRPYMVKWIKEILTNKDKHCKLAETPLDVKMLILKTSKFLLKNKLLIGFFVIGGLVAYQASREEV